MTDTNLVLELKGLMPRPTKDNGSTDNLYHQIFNEKLGPYVSRWLKYRLSGKSDFVQKRHLVALNRFITRYPGNWFGKLARQYLDDFYEVVKDKELPVELDIKSPWVAIPFGFLPRVAEKSGRTEAECMTVIVAMLARGELLQMELVYMASLQETILMVQSSF